MMEQIYPLIKFISVCIVVIFVCGMQQRINTIRLSNRQIRKKSFIKFGEKWHFSRGKQAIIPVITLIFCIIGVLRIYSFYDNFVTTFAAWVDSIPWIGEWTRRINVTWENLAIFIANSLLMLTFIPLKIILVPIVDLLWNKQSLMEATSSNFYEYDEEENTWFLKNEWKNFRELWKWITNTTTILCILFLFITWIVGHESAMWVFAFPGAWLLVVNEIGNFLNGQTKEEEMLQKQLESETPFKRISRYHLIRPIYEKVFAPQLLSVYTEQQSKERHLAKQLLEDLSASENAVDRIVADYFHLYDGTDSIDADYVQATIQLMQRENVLFFNPFYRDLSSYIALPIENALLTGKKCLVITGRVSTCEDVSKWLLEILANNCKMESMWRVAKLSETASDCELGILSYQQLYDAKLINANREFFKHVDFVVLIEPSLIVNTGQMGLNIIAKEMNKPVYCIADRKTEGLVDTLSHLLGTEITNVLAMPVPQQTHTGMSWDADGDFFRHQLFDKQTRYLGNGVELAAVAVKNQIPKAHWYSETKAPVRDIKWIAGQSYPTICRYMNIPAGQKNFYEKIDFHSNIWNVPIKKEQFLVAEDEFCNMFGTTRLYLSRGSEQTFINILSENYLLRDYMRFNQQIFTSDPNAIPSLVPHYAKTERNTIVKLIILMSIRPVSEQEITGELRLIGYKFESVFKAISKLLTCYTDISGQHLTITNVQTEQDDFTVSTMTYYSLPEPIFVEHFSESFKNAYFLVEDEQEQNNFIDGKLFGHVTQNILPDQFVTYNGKYYKVKFISPEAGVVLRRSADLYDKRSYYRQWRTYQFGTSEQTHVHKIMDIEIAHLRQQFSVNTSGYLEMSDNSDFRTAREVDFSADSSMENYVRSYKNKTVLRIMLPETTEEIRFTICLLLMEVFRTVFPDAWQYIAVGTKHEIGTGTLEYLMYKFEGEIEDGYVYIVEDSDLDLGLLEAIEQNLMQLMEIITDFIHWHLLMVADEVKLIEAPKEMPPKMLEAQANEESPRQAEVAEENNKKRTDSSLGKISYQQKQYLKFGFDVMDSRIQLEETYKYLCSKGWNNSALAKARKASVLKDDFSNFDDQKSCDFCKRAITKVSYEQLDDGRIRCNECSILLSAASRKSLK